MSAAELVRQARTDGVVLTLSPSGTILAKGTSQAVSRWLPVLRAHKPALVRALKNDAEDREILGWLECIGETDPETIRAMLSKCSRDPDARRYFLGRARGESTDGHGIPEPLAERSQSFATL